MPFALALIACAAAYSTGAFVPAVVAAVAHLWSVGVARNFGAGEEPSPLVVLVGGVSLVALVILTITGVVLRMS